MRHATTRRRFLGQLGLGAGAAIALPQFLARSVLGANDKVLIGHIGVRNQGMGNLKRFAANSVAVCDVDEGCLKQAYSEITKRNQPCEGFKDFRKLLDRKDIDAVVTSTPDHWHALITALACQAGKDVYCEKPLTLTIAEGRAMVEAARKHKRIVQTGSQQRSDDKFRLACELVRSGRIGKVKRVLVGIAGVNWKPPPVPDSSPPPELDYEMWLGPAPDRPYNEKRVHYFFRFFWDYSGGQITNWGAHHGDIAQWGLGMDESGPIAIEGTAKYEEHGWYETPERFSVTYTYGSGVTMLCGMDQPGGTTFEGADGTIHVNRGKLESTPADIVKAPLKPDDVHLYESKDHHKDWLECIASRKLPICDVAIGHRSATVCHLGNIAIRTGRKITWDPAKEEIVGDAAANAMQSRPYRAPWKL
jgi:predicted dehydrogenase